MTQENQPPNPEQENPSEQTPIEATVKTPEQEIAELNEKMGKLLELTQAIDWKLWVYLKANNYIE